MPFNISFLNWKVFPKISLFTSLISTQPLPSYQGHVLVNMESTTFISITWQKQINHNRSNLVTNPYPYNHFLHLVIWLSKFQCSMEVPPIVIL